MFAQLAQCCKVFAHEISLVVSFLTSLLGSLSTTPVSGLPDYNFPQVMIRCPKKASGRIRLVTQTPLQATTHHRGVTVVKIYYHTACHPFDVNQMILVLVNYIGIQRPYNIQLERLDTIVLVSDLIFVNNFTPNYVPPSCCTCHSPITQSSGTD
jgi:hypothetical protein